MFPVGEGFAVGLLFAMGNFCGFLLGLILSLIVGDGTEKSRTFGALGFCWILFILGLLLTLKMKE